MKRLAGLVAALALLLVAAPAAARERLSVDFMVSSGAQRTAWVALLDEFQRAHPDVELQHQEFEQEVYKRDFAQRLRSGQVDVAFWFAGERLRQAVADGLLQPVDPRWLAGTEYFTPAAYEGVQLQGRVYAVPLAHYAWGFFYRRSVFERLGLVPPRSWTEFLQLCDRLKAARITCTATGGKAGWPLAAWFDHLDLRLNGLAFHQQLLRGEKRFSDPKVAAVFAEWRLLLERGHFLAETMDEDWDRVLPYLYRGLVGTALMGGFAAARFPASLRDDIGFFPFPRIKAEVPAYEVAPLDVLVLPAAGRASEARRHFVQFVVQSGALHRFNAAVQTLPPILNAPTAAEPSLAEAQRVLEQAAGLAFFFDRDAREPLIRPAFDALRRFAKPPYDARAAAQAIDAASPR